MDILNTIFNKFATGLMSVLPHSPFTQWIDAFKGMPYLGWLNWFIPVRDMLIIFKGYLVAVTIYYLYSIIMRWVKALE